MVFIGFGSQTGCAREIARNIANRVFEMFGVPCDCGPLNSFAELGVLRHSWVVLVVSTLANGDLPDHDTMGCDKFCRFLRRRTHSTSTLLGMRFAILSVGSTAYDQFRSVGKMLDKRMAELGAIRFADMGE